MNDIIKETKRINALLRFGEPSEIEMEKENIKSLLEEIFKYGVNNQNILNSVVIKLSKSDLYDELCADLLNMSRNTYIEQIENFIEGKGFVHSDENFSGEKSFLFGSKVSRKAVF